CFLTLRKITARTLRLRSSLTGLCRFDIPQERYTTCSGSRGRQAVFHMRHVMGVSLCAPVLMFVATPLFSATEPVNREAVVNRYCVQCHSRQMKAGGLVLEGIAGNDVPAHPEIWEKIVRKLKAGEMPPPNLPRPDAAAIKALTE